MPLVILGGKRDRQNNRGRQRQQLCADVDPRPRVSPAKRVLKRGQYRSGGTGAIRDGGRESPDIGFTGIGI